MRRDLLHRSAAHGKRDRSARVSSGCFTTMLVALLLSMLAPVPLEGQSPGAPIDLELQLAGTHEVPCVYWCDSATKGGWATGGDIGVAIGAGSRASVSVLLSYYHLRLRAMEPALRGQGVSVLVRLGHGPGPWIEVGGIIHRREIRYFTEAEDPLTTYSDLGAGFQLGAGLAVPIGKRLEMSPVIQVKRFSATYEAPGRVPIKGRHSTTFLMAGLRMRIPLKGS